MGSGHHQPHSAELALPDPDFFDAGSGYTWPWVDPVGATKLYVLPAKCATTPGRHSHNPEPVSTAGQALIFDYEQRAAPAPISHLVEATVSATSPWTAKTSLNSHLRANLREGWRCLTVVLDPFNSINPWLGAARSHAGGINYRAPDHAIQWRPTRLLDSD